MKKKQSIFFITALLIISIVIFTFSIHTYFSIEFDARDNYWPFSRYYLTIYKSEILFLFLSFLGLLLSIFTKNITNQKYGRFLVIFSNYTLKTIIALALISALSSMHTLLNTNNFNSFLPISFLIIPTSFILLATNFIILVREIISKFRKSELVSN